MNIFFVSLPLENRRKWDTVREAALRTAGGNIKTFKNQ